MKLKEFDKLFEGISRLFTFEEYAEIQDNLKSKSFNLNRNYPKFDSRWKIWDKLEDIGDAEFLDLGNGKYIDCKHLFKKPIRILFFVQLVELEGRMYSVLEWSGKNTKDLDKRINFYDYLNYLNESKNEAINVIFKRRYNSKKKFKDLGGLNSFRDDVMHADKKLEKRKMEEIIKNKERINGLMVCLQSILDKMEREQIG